MTPASQSSAAKLSLDIDPAHNLSAQLDPSSRELHLTAPEQAAWQAFSRGNWRDNVYLLGDVVSLVASIAILGVSFPKLHLFKLLYTAPMFPASHDYLGLLILHAILTICFCKSSGAYDLRRSWRDVDEAVGVSKAVASSIGVIGAFCILSNKESAATLLLILMGIVNIVFMCGWRYCRRWSFEHSLVTEANLRNVLIVGAGSLGKQVAHDLTCNPHFGCKVQGYIDDNPQPGDKILGSLQDLATVARQHFVDEIFVTQNLPAQMLRDLALEGRRKRIEVKFVPEVSYDLLRASRFEQVGKIPVLSLNAIPTPIVARLVKRLLDILGAGAVLLLLSPVFVVIALIVRFDSAGPIIYRSYRLGKKGIPFVFYKFRTMIHDADSLKPRLRTLNERQGAFFKLAHDPRVTRAGKVLRRYSLDELPQLWNVIKGNMSLVGPRPHPQDDCEQYQLRHLQRLDVTPGITGLWQIKARQNPSFETNVALDLEYITRWSLWLDIKILMKTIPAVLQGQGQ